MHIVISGSMQHAERMTEIADMLAARGHVVQTPKMREGAQASVSDAQRRELIDEHFAKLDKAEAVLVVNEDKSGTKNYIGGSTLIEIAYAYSRGLDIFLLNPVPDLSYTDEIRGMHPVLLDGDLNKIDEYVNSLPLVFMSTESELKHLAVSRAFRRARMPVRMDGKKVPSGVSESPSSIDETYDGAMHRHGQLRAHAPDADYYATIESGNHKIHERHNNFSSSVVVIEPNGSAERVGISIGVEFPAEMLAKVPSQYPDLGVLVQQEYGATSKDPMPYFTNGRLTRQQLLENAFYNVIVQLPTETS